jgi:hypothetical protein
MFFTQPISSAITGWTALTLPSATGTNTNAIPCDCTQEVRFFFDLTRVASTNLQFTIEGVGVKSTAFTTAIAATDWKTLRSESITAGVGTLSAYSQLDTAAATRYLTTVVPTDGLVYVRLRDVFGTGSTSDTLTITAQLVQNSRV